MLAGQGGYASIGGELRLANLDYLALRATVGIKYNTTAADNANIASPNSREYCSPFYFDEMIHVGVGTYTSARSLKRGWLYSGCGLCRFHLTKIRDRVWRLCMTYSSRITLLKQRYFREARLVFLSPTLYPLNKS